MSIADDNILFGSIVSQILAQASAIERYSHLFDSGRSYDTALERFDLRTSARQLRLAADRLDNIADQVQGPATAFPDTVDLRQIAAE